MTMTLTMGAASLSRTMMRRGRHHDPPSSGGGRRGGGRSSLRCPASPVQRTSPCADSDRTSPRCHPCLRLPTGWANPRRLRIIGSHPEGGDVRGRRLLLHLGGGGIVPHVIHLRQRGGATASRLPTTMCSAGRGTRTNTSSRIFRGSGGVVGGMTTMDDNGGRGEEEGGGARWIRPCQTWRGHDRHRPHNIDGGNRRLPPAHAPLQARQ